MTTEQAPNFEAIIEWTKENRPDCLDSVRQLLTNDATAFLLSIGFAAGRKYQAKHPALDPRFGYHR